VERVQITDFGLARAIDDASMTRSGIIAGTPQYMSPEQAHGDEIDSRSDLFSLGSVMYFMLTGRSPFRAQTTMGVLNRISNDPPRSLSSINADVPSWLEEIISRLLAKDPNQRFQSARELAELLSRWQAHLQRPNLIDPPQPVTRLQSQKSSITTWLALVALAGVLIWMAGILILETGKGTIRIESNGAAEVPIRIRKGNEIVDQLTVTEAGQKTRLQAGEYVVEIDGDSDSYLLEGDQVTLKRGTEWLVRVQLKGEPKTEMVEVSTLEHGEGHVEAPSAFAPQQHKAVDPFASPTVEDLNAQYEKEKRQYLYWEESGQVRLTHWFAQSVKLNANEIQQINQLLTDTWNKYCKLESGIIRYSESVEGHLVVDMGWENAYRPEDYLTLEKMKQQFLRDREELDNEFWTKLDEIVSGEKRAFLHAISTMRGDGQGDDSWENGRSKALPSLLGYVEELYPVRIEIWKKGTWSHWKIFTRKNSSSGDGQTMPAELLHYYQQGKKFLAENGNYEPLRNGIKRVLGVICSSADSKQSLTGYPALKQWEQDLIELWQCEDIGKLDIETLYVNDGVAVAISTIVTDPNGRKLIAEMAFHLLSNGDWSLEMLDVEPANNAQRDLDRFLKDSPGARKIPFHLPEYVLNDPFGMPEDAYSGLSGLSLEDRQKSGFLGKSPADDFNSSFSTMPGLKPANVLRQEHHVQIAWESAYTYLDLETGKTEGPRAVNPGPEYVDKTDLHSSVRAKGGVVLLGNLLQFLQVESQVWEETNRESLDAQINRLYEPKTEPVDPNQTLATVRDTEPKFWLVETHEGSIALLKVQYNPEIHTETSGIKSGFDVYYSLVRFADQKKKNTEAPFEAPEVPARYFGSDS
ncbi:MAG: serine/threonine protein kinase, partial [Planctomycetaceae bacterium]|nr:serine/threonine protein kinase [Planctomycetaceae bacterium]